jgi:hypothetical protein
MRLAAPRLAPLPLRVSPETLRRATLWLMVFGGSITMFEPSPYEAFGLLAFLTWGVSRLALPREAVPILVLVLLYMTGSLATLTLVTHRPNTVMWTIIGWYLAITGLFYIAVLAEETQARLAVIVHAYVSTAVICSAIGLLAYARLLPASDSFLLYGRVKSTFEDPNVFGPFLVFPALILIQQLYISGSTGALRYLVPLLIIVGAIFLSFSRGAWGHLIASAGLMTAATFLCARSRPLRLRIVILCIAGALGLAAFLALLLTFDAVRELFEQRASLEQSYDVGQFGRFNRHWLGFVMALDHPLGIGMLQFGPIFGEDTHNTYLNAFMSYGWIGGVSWPAIVLLTLAMGWRAAVIEAPWRPVFICVMSTYSVAVAEAWIIDIDHWRHVWLLFGAAWGLTIASMRHRRAALSRSLPVIYRASATSPVNYSLVSRK